MSQLLRVGGAALVRGGRLLFEGLNLSLAPGEAAHVTGPNGCGKSSLMRMVAGLLRPSAGRIERAAVALADHGLALDRDGVARLDAAIAGHRASGGAVLAASHVALAGQWREVAL